MPKIMFGSFQPDVESIDTQGSSYVHNVIPTASGYGPFKDLVDFAEALPARCLGAFGVIDDDNTSHIFAGTSTKLYKLNPTTRAWADVTRASGDYSVASREYWSFAIFGQNIVAVTDGNNPQLFTLGSSSVFDDLGGSPPQARRVAVVGDFLVLIGLTSNPNRIQWSGINDIEEWTPGTASSDYQDFPDGGQTVNVSSGEFGLVFQDTAIRRMIFNPVSPSIFDFSRISETRGLFMPHSLVKVHSAAFFYSSDGFYRIDGTGALTPIGENRVDATLGADIDLTNPRFMIGVADPGSTRIMWFYKSVDNGNENKLDKVLIFDWQRNQWAQASIDVEYICTTSALGATLEGLDSLGDLDALPFSLDLYQTTPKFRVTGFDTLHAPGYFDGDALEATLDLPEATLGAGVRMAVRSVAPLSDAVSAYVKIGKREHLNGAVTYSNETAINFRGYAPQRASGRFLTARLRIPAGANWSWVRGLDVDAVNMGLR